MIANIPRPSYFSDAFGGAQLPGGIGYLLYFVCRRAGLDGPAVEALPQSAGLAAAMALLLLVCVLLVVWKVTRNNELRATVRRLTQRELLCQVAGAALMCGCFALGRSIGYREVAMLLVLPGLLALGRLAPSRPIALFFRGTAWAAVFLMGYLLPQRLIFHFAGSIVRDGGSLAAYGFWLIREICWWWLIAVLTSLLLCFAIDSRTGREATGAVSRMRRRMKIS
jgi:hypothetical protein